MSFLWLSFFVITSCEWTTWYGVLNEPDIMTTYESSDNAYITRLCLRHNDKIVSIGNIDFSDDVSNTGMAGGSDGIYACIATPDGDCLSGVDIKYDNNIEKLLFRTLNGLTSVVFGSNKSTSNEEIISTNRCLSKISVRHLDAIDAIMFYFTPYLPNGTINSDSPTQLPTNNPTINPSNTPTQAPSISPTIYPTIYPTITPTVNPTMFPSNTPTNVPSGSPSNSPTNAPSDIPTEIPTNIPTNYPTSIPTNNPTSIPTDNPSINPSNNPSNMPTDIPTNVPSITPTRSPTNNPTESTVNNDSMTPQKSSRNVFQLIYEDGTVNGVMLTIIIVGIILLCCLIIFLLVTKIFTKYVNNLVWNNIFT